MRIGLIGKMHSGKGEIAAHLVATHGFHKLAFADPVKDASVAAINAALASIGREPTMTRELLERDKAQLRLLPQFIGTELGRQYLGDPNIWIDMLLAKVREIGAGRHIVVDDCRFPNEAAALKGAGFSLVRVERPEPLRFGNIWNAMRAAEPGLSDREYGARAGRAMHHPSETEVDTIAADVVLDNDGSLRDLRRLVDQVVVKGGSR